VSSVVSSVAPAIAVHPVSLHPTLSYEELPRRGESRERAKRKLVAKYVHAIDRISEEVKTSLPSPISLLRPLYSAIVPKYTSLCHAHLSTHVIRMYTNYVFCVLIIYIVSSVYVHISWSAGLR